MLSPGGQGFSLNNLIKQTKLCNRQEGGGDRKARFGFTDSDHSVPENIQSFN